MKRIVAFLMVFFGSFLLASEKLLPNGINPETHHINIAWGAILFFMWPIIVIAMYKFAEFTLRKTGVESDV